MSRKHTWILVLGAMAACRAAPIRRPGPQADGSVLLPNGWSLTAAGEQVNVGDLPLAMVVSPDDRYLLVANNGYADQYVSILEIARRQEIARLPMERSWLGLALDSRGQRLYVSGGASDTVASYRFVDGRVEEEQTLSLPRDGDPTPCFTAGLAVTPDGRWLLAAALRQGRVVRFDLESGARRGDIEVGAFPYAVVTHPDNRRAFVSNWGDRSISVLDVLEGKESERIPVGSHPNAMVLSGDGTRLYVANASSSDLSILDLRSRKVVETVDLSPYPGAPGGTTPNGLALSSSGATLYVVNADNNDLAVVDVSRRPAVVQGLIPTGWYPTAVACTSDDRTLFIANGKGLGSRPNPGGPQPVQEGPREQRESHYIGLLFPGTVSFVPRPDAATLDRYSAQVIANNGFSGMDRKLVRGPADLPARAVPRRVGEPSRIQYVFYIIKENRTYDQVFGDLPQGEGDPALTLFGRDVTPNHHALAEQYVLFDNFYVDAEVSADGHEWSMGAIATDFVEKLWPTTYSDRGFPYPSEGAFGIAFPDAGYLWDAAARAGISYRSYGEFAEYGPDQSDPMETPMETLRGHVAPRYPPFDLTVPDVDRAAAFVEDFQQLLAAGAVPRLNILRLPGDHTAGTRPGSPTPLSMMADNDLALGRIVEVISHSPLWEKTAIIVVEDDSQNGPDHIDAHRSLALIASPYARRGFVDHTMYDTVSLLRTIELLLGLDPMSQYDAAAIPLFLAFQDQPDPTPFVALENRVPLDDLNTKDSYGAAASLRMNLEELDAAPEELLNEIVWKSVRGAASVMPRPHTNRRWFELDEEQAEEEDEGSGR